MEGEDKSKKVAKEKRSVKSKPVAPAAKEIPAARVAETLSVRKSITGAGTARSPVRPSRTKELTYEQVQLRAYFIAERRKSLGISGDETSDWVQAELELEADLASK
jgi:hypothetical protein